MSGPGQNAAAEAPATGSSDDDRGLDLPRVARRCAQLATDVRALGGPGASAVRSAARQLALALELYVQNQRRLEAEVLRD